MAGNDVTPDRIKRLFSSFLGRLQKTEPNDQPDINNQANTKENDDTEGIKSDSHDKKAYFDRVETYSSLTWFAKPSDLVPLVCARYGWENVDTDMLQCVSCKNYLSGELPAAVDTPVYRKSCEKLKNGLVSAHENLCPWSNNPCPETFGDVPYYNRVEMLSEFQERLRTLTTATNSLPAVTRDTLESQGLDEDRLQNFYNEVKTSQTDDTRPGCSLVACLFALCGWGFSNQSNVEILVCNYCRRRVGLWNYQSSPDRQTNNGAAGDSKENGQADEKGDEEPSFKRQKMNKQSFDPVAEHRYWCPWLRTVSTTEEKVEPCRKKESETSQCPAESPSETAEIGLGGKPAWFAVASVLSSEKMAKNSETIYSQMKLSPQLEGVRRLRRVLKDCTSPTSPPEKLVDSS